MTVSQAVLFEAFPREEAGMAMALFGLGVMVGPTIGPTLGGWITDNYGWPWIFYINLPVGILAAVMIGTYVHDSLHQRKPPTVDYIGIALLAVSVGAIRSRQDAIRALDAVAQFFRQNEPSSPIPLFLERAKRLVSKDFLEVLADIAPEAIPQARAAGGLKQGE